MNKNYIYLVIAAWIILAGMIITFLIMIEDVLMRVAFSLLLVITCSIIYGYWEEYKNDN